MTTEEKSKQKSGIPLIETYMDSSTVESTKKSIRKLKKKFNTSPHRYQRKKVHDIIGRASHEAESRMNRSPSSDNDEIYSLLQNAYDGMSP